MRFLPELTKKRERRSSRKKRSLLVENLEHRHLLAALVGVDFDNSANVPTNWTSIGTASTPLTQNNLVDEDGNATPFDLTISETGAATATCGANQICAAAATVTGATVPSHTQSLAGIDGQIYTDADPVSLTWGDLTPGTDYEVYVFGLEGFFPDIQQDVQITGAGSPVTFTQNFTQGNLYINDEAGSSARSLSSYAEIVTADGSGEITIDITPNGFTLDVSLGGVAIREITAPELTVSIAADSISEGDGAAATIGTVTRNSDTTNALVVNLTSDDTSEATVPTSVTIPAGSTFATFDVDAVDDGINDLIQTVTVTASATGHAGDSDTVDVVDDDAVLTLSLTEDAVLETAPSGTLRALISTTITTDVILQSSSGKVLTGGAVTVTAGFPLFVDLDVVDNSLDDGSELVTITAIDTNAPAEFIPGVDTVVVIDDEFSADLNVDIVAPAVSEADGAGATTATVSRLSTGPTDVFVSRGVSISDTNSTESASNNTTGPYTVGFAREDPLVVLDHEVNLISDVDALGADAEGFVSIDTDSNALNPINDSSFFEIYFDLTTSHDFILLGSVFADADDADAQALVELTGPGTNLTFSQVDNFSSTGGLTNINETGTLGPGTYHLVGRAQAFSAGNLPAAEASFDLDLQLTATALTVDLVSDDTTEATVPATVTIAAGQTTSPAFDIDAVDDALVDGTQTVTVTASFRRTH